MALLLGHPVVRDHTGGILKSVDARGFFENGADPFRRAHSWRSLVGFTITDGSCLFLWPVYT